MNIVAEYQCDKCGIIEIMQKHTAIRRKCPECKGKIERLISLPLISRMNEPRTLGSLAEKNAKKRPEKAQLSESEKKQLETKSKVDRINKMSAVEKQRYIMEGD